MTSAENTAPLERLPSRTFEPLLFGVGAWTDHLHAGYDLVALTKPRLLVELGTDRGESYFCFCQSAVENNTGTRCWAVDTWRGDEHAGNYDETTFRQVTAHNREHYDKFSTLLRGSFDEALPQFEAESIDLLHLDGLHTEEAVTHDLDQWLPKLRPGGILLVHDVAVRSRHFGVWKVWERLREDGRSFLFEQGPGLGLWQKPPVRTLAPELEPLLTAPNPARERLVEYYRARASELQERLKAQWSDGSIRRSAFALQTIIQIFYTRDGTHREEDSVFARVGHEEWKELTVRLPVDGWDGPLRIDFVSAFTTIDIATIAVSTETGMNLFAANQDTAFAGIAIAGDAERVANNDLFSIEVTGIDPQLHLPRFGTVPAVSTLVVRMKLFVRPTVV